MPELSKKTRRYIVAVMWLLAIGGVGLMGWLQMSGKQKPPEDPKSVQEADEEPSREETGEFIEISPESVERAYRLKNLGVAEIENERYAEAINTLKELRETIPVDGFVERNLLIAAILQMQIGQEADSFGGDHPLRDSVVIHNLEMKVDQFIAHFLAGKLHEQEKDFPGALDEYRESVKLHEKFVAGWYTAYIILKGSRDETSRQEGLTFLRKGVSLLPENLFLQVELLQYEAELKAAEVSGTLDAIAKLIQPFREGIEKRTRINLQEMFDQGKAEVEQGNWGDVLRKARILTNVLRPEEIYQEDKSEVDPHLSSYMLTDFVNRYPRLRGNTQSTEPVKVEWKTWRLEGIGSITDAQDLIVEDFDLDGRLDVCVLRLEKVEVYSRGVSGENWNNGLSIDLPQGFQRLIAADLDNDFEESKGIPVPQEGMSIPPCQSADLDLVVYGSAGIATIENLYDSEEKRRKLLLKPLSETLNSQAAVRVATSADLDGDGDLDLILGRTGSIEIWANRGGLEFYDISNRSSLPMQPAVNSIVIADGDGDVDQDVILLGGEESGILENQRHGRFQWQQFAEGSAKRYASVKDAAIGQRNRLWLQGIVILDETKLQECYPFFQPQEQQAASTERTLLQEISARRFRLLDLDNNGVNEFMIWGDAGLDVYLMQSDLRSQGRRRVWEPQESLVVDGRIQGCDFGDFDHDGDLDLMWCGEEGLHGATNEGGNHNHWIDLSLIAQQIKESGPTASGRVNSHGIGSVIELKTGRDYQSAVVTRPSTHFGLGNRERVDVCRILWANGIPGNLIEPKQNEFICEQQTLKGSCPYLYAWNGERVEFVTDLLWGAPIGLQFAEGILATPREWEYLKIPGAFIQENEGIYDLRITEELWEAAYFDEVKLFAVDHPEEIEIETNEKVGPPAIAEHRLFTARTRHLPVAAHDSQGNDLLPQLSKKDDDYVGSFHNKLRQGLTENHFLELDFGKLPKFEQIHLYLTGWLYPTDTSINVAISNDPRMNPSRPLSIQVPDAQGNWQEVVPFCGFPGGKTKTVVYDLSQIFLTEDYRIRLVSNMEFYWDSAWFTVNEPGETVEMTELSLQGAILRYRGFSATVEHPRNGPERYDYETVSRTAKWPPLGGKLTRFGEVTELIREGDDRLVVMAGGDELQLRFEVPEKSLPPGWKRDFVLYNVGWDKDADLNTVAGSSVEPLPYRTMDTYPPLAPESSPEWDEKRGDAYRKYLSTYQTRTQSPRSFWSHVLSSNLDQRP